MTNPFANYSDAEIQAAIDNPTTAHPEVSALRLELFNRTRTADPYDDAIAKAAEIGREHGASAASWFDTPSEDDCRRILTDGLFDVFDPETVPAPDLSGEWADSYSAALLVLEVGPQDLPEDQQDEYVNSLCDAYELAFSAAVEAEIVRVCQYQLAD